MVASSASVELPPFYYRDNFLCLCDTVEDQYGDILAGDELEFLRTFRTLSSPAQCLYVRLVSRVGPWFRAARLAYGELGDSQPILAELDGLGLLHRATSLTPGELGALFTRDELLAVLGEYIDSSAVSGKPSLLAAIAESPLDAAASTRMLCDFDGESIVGPLYIEQVQCLQVLFFGNRRQGLTDFVLSDLGVARYFPYSLDRGHRLFADRMALDEYLACAAFSDRWYELRDAGPETPVDTDLLTLAVELLQVQIVHDSSRGRWYRLCNGVARDLERVGELETALELYAASGRHPCRERRARILERSGRLREARALCERILEQPWCEEERDAADRILPRLRRALEGVPQPRRRDSFDELQLELPRGDLAVEVLAALALEREWASVHYVENTLMNALFGLAFWEQIFLPVPGAFHNPFQSVPGDMYQPEFSRRRRTALDRRLGELARQDLGQELVDAWHRYRGYQCRWVDWRKIDPELVARVTALVPPGHLLAIWERMLFDPGENRRGFPDLIALGEKPGDYCLIEVKGPGDALQDSQKRWLRFFREQAVPARVAWVEWCDD